MKSSTPRATSRPTSRATTTATERGKASPGRTAASPSRIPARTAASPSRIPARTASSPSSIPARTTSSPSSFSGRTAASPSRAPSKVAASPARATASPSRAPAKAVVFPSRAAASPSRAPTKAGASPARTRGVLTKATTMSAAVEPPITPPRRSTSSIRQSAILTKIPTYSGGSASMSRGSVSPPLSTSVEGNSPVKSNSMSIATRIPSPRSVKGTSPGRSSVSPRQILSHEFLSKSTSKSRGQSPLNRSIDEPNQLRRQSAPASSLQDYMSKSQDHGSFAMNRSIDRGLKSLSRSQNQGPKSLSTSQDRGFKSFSPSRGMMSLSTSQDRGFKSLSTSQDRGFKSLSTSQDRGFKGLSASQDMGIKSMSTSQDSGFQSLSTSLDRGFLTKSQDKGSYANLTAKPATVPEYGYDGRRISMGARDAAAPRMISPGLNRRDTVSLHLQMGRSVDSTVSLSTTASSPIRGNRQSFRDAHRLVPLQLSDPVMSQGYRSGDVTPEETSPLDGRVPSRMHRQLKSPDFFDVKKLAGDGGVITAVSRMHDTVPRAETTGAAASEDGQDANRPKLHPAYEQRRDSLADSARKAFSVDTDSTIGSSNFSSEINFELEKVLSGAQDLLEIGSWNDDDEEYLRIFKLERGNGDHTKASDSAAAVTTSNGANGSSKKWAQHPVSQYDNALYQKSEPDSELGTSTQGSPQTSPPRATIAAQPVAVSRISSTSATSIDLNRSTDTTCSTYSQYDNAIWADPPIKGTFRPWNPKREAEMMPSVVIPPPTTPVAEIVHSPPEPPPVAELDETRMLRYNDGLERLTSYMKTANQSARKKRGMSDELSSSQASGCFDYLVDFLESQTSIADVLVSAHDETLKLNDFTHSVGAAQINPEVMKRLDSKMTNDTAVLSSSRSIESRITDLGSEASWESGKSRSVQTLGTTGGKVMDQITEKVDSLSFDSPKHLSTFKFGLKKITLGESETITSSEHSQSKSDGVVDYFPHRKSVSIPMVHAPCPSSPNLSWPSQTAPSSINASRNPSRNPSRSLSRNASRNASRNLSRSPSERAFADASLAGFGGARVQSPHSTSSRNIKIVSEAGVESRREEDSPPSSSSVKPPVAEETRFPSPELLPLRSFKKMRVASPKPAAAVAVAAPAVVAAPSPALALALAAPSPPPSPLPGSTSPTVEPPAKNVQMQHRSDDPRKVGSAPTPERTGIGKRMMDRDANLSLSLDHANKGCGCNIL